MDGGQHQSNCSHLLRLLPDNDDDEDEDDEDNEDDDDINDGYVDSCHDCKNCIMHNDEDKCLFIHLTDFCPSSVA